MHIAHIRDGNGTSIYGDGVPIVERVARTLNTADTKTFKIGYWKDCYFDGLIDDVRVYTVGLSASAVQTLAISERAAGVDSWPVCGQAEQRGGESGDWCAR